MGSVVHRKAGRLSVVLKGEAGYLHCGADRSHPRWLAWRSLNLGSKVRFRGEEWRVYRLIVTPAVPPGADPVEVHSVGRWERSGEVIRQRTLESDDLFSGGFAREGE